MKTGGLFLSIFLLSSLCESAQLDSLLDGMLANLRPCVSMRFEITTTMAISGKKTTSQGELKACSPDRFRLEMNDLTVTSDGRTLWRHSSKTNQTVVQDAGKGQTYNPLDWLRFHKEDFRQSGAKKENRNGRSTWHISFLDPKTDLNVREFHLWLDWGTLQPNEMTLDDGEGNLTSYKIRKIRPAKDFPKETFVFAPPKGAEIFDQRNSPADK